MCKITKEDRKEFIGQVIDVFEDFLDKKGIIISNDERDIDSDLEPEGSTNIYGNDYDSIREKLEKLFINWSVLEDERPLVEYLFEVSINGSKCGGTISVEAYDSDTAYQKAQDQVAEALYKALPTLDIEYDIELVQEEGYPKYRVTYMMQSSSSAEDVVDFQNFVNALDLYKQKLKGNPAEIYLLKKTCENAKWSIIK